MNPMSGMTYKQAGVDIEKGNRLVNTIRDVATRTNRPEVVSGIGGFGALFEIPLDRYKHPLLVSATDGVGTKLKLAIDLNNYQGLGIDLVAMCVNDILCQGAEPLFFLDYYATSQLDTAVATAVIKSIADGCQQANTALIGGETAEMPGLYAKNDFDLAGFCVGIVEKAAIISASRVKIGDKLIGLASSGPHANGYTLIRELLTANNINTQTLLDNKPLHAHLLAPTKIYAKSLLSLQKKISLHSVAHITGGGLLENVPRTLPDELQAIINTDSWTWPSIFEWLQQQGNIATDEMYRVFNCGVGMVIGVAEKDVDASLNHLASCGETAWVIGQVAAKPDATSPSIVGLT